MQIEPLQILVPILGAFSGLVVGFALGLFGAGGSILAVPLLVYFVGIENVHVAVGSSAVAVAANAGANLLSHSRYGRVEWRCAAFFASAGVAGAFAGSLLGKMIDGPKLLFLFSLLMAFVGFLMLRRRHATATAFSPCTGKTAQRTAGYGFATGTLAGFFGIGGGFLVVPGLIASTGMPMLSAVGTSLFVVSAFGITTSTSYAMSGLVDWGLAFSVFVGGTAGGVIGTKVAVRLSSRRGRLNAAFATLLFIAAAYVSVRSFMSF